MKETYCVPVEEIRRGIQHGVRKINVVRVSPLHAFLVFWSSSAAKVEHRVAVERGLETAFCPTLHFAGGRMAHLSLLFHTPALEQHHRHIDAAVGRRAAARWIGSTEPEIRP